MLADISFSGDKTKHEATALTVSTGKGLLPGAYNIGKAYPNPFNPITAIPLTLSEDTEIYAVIYDLRGRKISVLADDIFPSGRHSLRINAHNMATGVYIVRFIVNHEGHIRKIALMK